MKYSLNWLKEFVNINCTLSELVEKLTLSGFEVEGIEELGKNLQKIIVGKITKIEKHPNADRLQITKIYDGQNEHVIVTGATNVFEGAIVPFSVPGSVMASGLEIKKANLRGVDSFGMLCSEKELGVTEESAGIWLLPETIPLGIDFVDYYQLKDTVLDVSILPNRGDCLSIFGFAKEISVILNTPLKKPEIQVLPETPAKVNFELTVTAPELCPKYTARILENVKLQDSPFWLKRRLEISGIRPINNVVDITNYLLLEFGQPLHAFDLTELSDAKIIVRRALDNEPMTTLDANKHELTSSDLVIADSKRPVALGGIMGGLNSEIKATTKDILLEAAYFDPKTIRKTESRLKLKTESSIRFEKGIDFELVEFVSYKASQMLSELAEAKITNSFHKVVNSDYPGFKPRQINFSVTEINRFLDTEFSAEQMQKVLTQLGFQFNKEKDQVIVPSWRLFDVQEMPCLAEEIARILGYDKIKTKLPEKNVIITEKSKLSLNIDTLRETLIDYGFFEAKTFPMVSEEDQLNLEEKTELKLRNPISPRESVLRTSLLPSLIKVLSFNYNRGINDLKIFENNKVFFDNNQELPLEQVYFSGLIIGKNNPKAYLAEDKNNNHIDFYWLKGLVENLLSKLNLDLQIQDQNLKPYLHPKKAVNIVIQNKVIGEFGFLNPIFTKKYDLDLEIAYFSLNLSETETLDYELKKFKSFSKYPSTKRDLSVLANKNVKFTDITIKINEFKPAELKDFYLIDHFTSEKLGSDKYSLTLSFIYQKDDESLKDDYVNQVHLALVEKLKTELAIEIR